MAHPPSPLGYGSTDQNLPERREHAGSEISSSGPGEEPARVMAE